MSDYRAVRYHDGERFLSALAREGRTLLHLVMIEDCGVVHRTTDRVDSRYLRPLQHHGAPYPVERMVKKFRAFGRERGITEAAKAELDAAVQS